MKKNKKENSVEVHNSKKMSYAEKVEELRDFYMSTADSNFFARCPSIELVIDTELGVIFRIVNDIQPQTSPPSSKALSLPLISLDYDFQILSSFFSEKVEKFDPNKVFTRDPIASAYDELIDIGMLEDYRFYRREKYREIFKIWVDKNRSAIEKIDVEYFREVR